MTEKDFLTPREFIDNFIAGRTEEIEGKEVRGNVSLYGETVGSAVRALDVTFWGEVDFSECRFERSVDLSGCQFAKTLSFSNSQIGGSLNLSECLVRTEASPNGKQLAGTESLKLSGLRVENDLLLVDTVIEYGTGNTKEMNSGVGDLIGEGLRVKGRTDLRGLKTDGDVNLKGGTFEGDVAFGAHRTETTRDGRSFIGRSLQMQNCRFHANLALEGLQVLRDVQLWAIDVQGILFSRAVALGDYAPKGDKTVFTHIIGDLNLGASVIKGVDLEATRIDGAFELFSARIGRMVVGCSNFAEASVFGLIRISSCTFDDVASLPNLVITGRHVKDNNRGLLVDQCFFNGDLRFWSQRYWLRDGRPILEDCTPDQLRTIVDGDLTITGCVVRGVLNLTNTIVSGRMSLDDTRVTRDVSFLSAETGKAALAQGGRPLRGPEDANLLKARAQALSMNNFSCENDIDLTGLQLEGPDAHAPDRAVEFLDSPKRGSVEARDLTVKGSLRLFAGHTAPLCDDENACIGSAAGVPGAIDLSGATIGTLALSFHSFEDTGDDRKKKAEECGLVLANAVIDEFELVRPVPNGRGLKVPRPINMRDVTVRQWSLGDAVARREAFESIVEVDERYRRSTYLGVEASLRNRGHDEDADYIYRSMMRRGYWVRLGDAWERLTRRPSPRALFLLTREVMAWPLRKLFFGFALGYGTSPSRLFFGIIMFWIAMMPFYLERANFEPSLAQLGAESHRYEDGAFVKADIPPDDWPISSAIAMSLRYHLPVVTLFARQDWDLNDDDVAIWNWCAVAPETSPCGKANAGDEKSLSGRYELWGSAEDVGIAVALLNWIAWPFVLAFAIGRFLRLDGKKGSGP